MPNVNKAPAIILVRPQLGENIGAVARAMSNFGLTDLRLVAPKNGWPNPRAVEMAAGGAYILESARVYESVEEAMHGITLTFATTARARDMERRVTDPETAACEMHVHAAQGGQSALLFGPERTGLENEDAVFADTLVTIATAPENPSLNISQSAVILAYAWHRQRADLVATSRPAHSLPAAPNDEIQGFFNQLEEYLNAVNHFRTPDKKLVMWQNLRGLFIRAKLSSQEVRTLRGVIRALYLRRREEEKFPPPQGEG